MEIYLRRMQEDRDRNSEYVGMDFANPLPLAELAQAMGVAAETISDPAELSAALERSIASGKPGLINVEIDGTV